MGVLNGKGTVKFLRIEVILLHNTYTVQSVNVNMTRKISGDQLNHDIKTCISDCWIFTEFCITIVAKPNNWIRKIRLMKIPKYLPNYITHTPPRTNFGINPRNQLQ